MGRSTAYWKGALYPDAGEEPAPDAPYSDLSAALASRFQLIREGLLEEDGVAEHIKYMGAKWRWTWEYALGSRKLCWLHPLDTQVGVTFTLTDHEAREVEELSRLPKFLTKAVNEGQQTGPVRWCEFDLADKKTAEAFLSFCRKKMEWLRAETPTLVVRRTSSSK